MKLTKAETKLHDEAVQLAHKRRLSDDEIDFVFDNFHPGATANITKGGMFFTPRDMAWDAACFHQGHGRVVDACAGIGVLARSLILHQGGKVKMTCIEVNPHFVEVGKKLVPEAKWICGDIFTTMARLPLFTSGISNPPFGHLPGNRSANFKSAFHFAVMELLLKHTELGAVMIIPAMENSQSDGGFWTPSANYKKFKGLYPQADIEPGPFDTSSYKFREAAPKVSICDLSKEAHGTQGMHGSYLITDH